MGEIGHLGGGTGGHPAQDLIGIGMSGKGLELNHFGLDRELSSEHAQTPRSPGQRRATRAPSLKT